MVGFLLFFVLGCVVALLAYRESETFRKKNGVTPWRLPSWAWALIGFCSLLVGAVLLAIARRTTDPVVGSGPRQ
jgi:drug/metabolite transporter (DMT)-like permease